MEYISVTQVLKIFSLIPSYSEEQPDYFKRGTAVHEYCKKYALGIWAIKPRGYERYCYSFEEWFNENVKKVYSVEEELRDDVYFFYGHPDIIVELKSREGIGVIDYKTSGSKNKLWALQLAAYHQLAKKKYNIAYVASLRLRGDGGFPLFYDYQFSVKDFSVFIQALNVYRYLFSKGEK